MTAVHEFTLGDAFDLQMGKTPSRSNPLYWGGENKWISISDIKDKCIYETKECISDLAVEETGIKVVPKGTLIMSFKLSVGKVAFTAEDMYTNEAIMAFIDKGKYPIDMEYLYHYLSNQDWRKGTNKAVKGLTLNKTTLSARVIQLPSLDEQREVAYSLNLLDRAIRICRQLLETADALVKARFVEMFGAPKENPHGFEMVSFEEIVEYMGDIGSNGANKVIVSHLDMKDEEDYALMIRFTNFTKNDFTDDVKYISKEAYDFFKKSQIFGGELIICKIGSAGQNYVMPHLDRPVSLGLNQIMVRIKDVILMPFLYQYLHTDYGKFLISGCINGAVTKTITKTELKRFQ